MGALGRYPTTAERAEQTGRGEGGDVALVIDRAAEDAVFRELERWAPVTAVSEERGQVAVAGGGAVHVVIDPIDGSLNAKRALPLYCLSIAVSSGPTMADVQAAYVVNLADGEEWTCRRGEGAFLGGEPVAPARAGGDLELLGVDSATPFLVARAAPRLDDRRPPAPGARLDRPAPVPRGDRPPRRDAEPGPCRSVDAAAGQLIVREAGGRSRSRTPATALRPGSSSTCARGSWPPATRSCSSGWWARCPSLRVCLGPPAGRGTALLRMIRNGAQ